MTCQHCCGADSIFDKKSAKRDFKRYSRKGPNKTTRSLLSALKKENIKGMSVLDIGGGIGVIQHELLKSGIVKTTSVDASSAYAEKAKSIAQENETLGQMEFIFGDFVDCAPSIEEHDIVTLERVVCCYPDVRALLLNSTDKASKYYALVYPKDTFLSRFLIRLSHLYFLIKGNPFRTFVHSERVMQKIVTGQGFELIHKDGAGIWRILLFKRD